MNFLIIKKYFSAYSKTLNKLAEKIRFPYNLGGYNIKHFNPTKKFESGHEFFDYIDEHNLDKDTNIFSFFRSKFEISKDFEQIVNEKYNSFIEGLLKIMNRHEKKLNYDNTLDEVIDHKFSTKLQTENYSQNLNKKFKLVKDTKNKNTFYLDKIFLHSNVNKYNKRESKLRKVENIFSKKLIIFNYESTNQEETINNSSNNKLFGNMNNKTSHQSKIIIVRLSIWAKISNNLIVEDLTNNKQDKELEKLSKYKIYDDEWHHIILQFEGESDSINYLKILKFNSFPRIISNFLFKNKEGSEFNIKNCKISDFDFYMNGNPISESEEFIKKNEFYFIKHQY